MAMTAGTAVAGRSRTALVGGGTRGMGRVIAAKLAADGVDIAVVYSGDKESAGAWVGESRAGAGSTARSSTRTEDSSDHG
jgi:3-oxoacyl-[acyl-carrier protein] reductase